MHIKAVTFDVGGTLIEPWPSVGYVYAQVATRNGVENISADNLDARFRIAWQNAVGFNNSRRAWEKLVDSVFLGIAAEPPSSTFFPELYERFAQPDVWRIYSDVQPTIDTLANGSIKVGIISNWDERLRPLLKRLHLENRFQSVTISCEAGACKPSPIIFQQAATQLGLPPDSILHVGDSAELDVQGARAAGFQAVRLHRGDGQPVEGEVRSLTEVPAMLLAS